MKTIGYRLMSCVSCFAMAMAAFSFYGQYCRTWFYQPPIAAHLTPDRE
ncbi:MAG: hypothetical protein FWH04_05780 [Oscillospiraceae bacterium]|nr:hypothetical protein [Oscillospiraceae bacterium]